MGISVEIIKGCKRGDRKAIKVFYEESSAWMLGVGLRYIPDRNEAMSVVNISLLSALEAMQKFDENRTESVESWLKTILIRKSIDYLRKEKMNGEEIIETTVKVMNEGESNRRKEELMGIINSLPPKTRAVFNLFAIEGYKHEEISELLNISDGTSKWHLSEARKLLRTKLELLDKIILAK